MKRRESVGEVQFCLSVQLWQIQIREVRFLLEQFFSTLKIDRFDWGAFERIKTTLSWKSAGVEPWGYTSLGAAAPESTGTTPCWAARDRFAPNSSVDCQLTIDNWQLTTDNWRRQRRRRRRPSARHSPFNYDHPPDENAFFYFIS